MILMIGLFILVGVLLLAAAFKIKLKDDENGLWRFLKFFVKITFIIVAIILILIALRAFFR